MSQPFARVESQARALELLKSWAEASDVERQEGVRILASAADLAREVGMDESDVHALLARLRRLSIALQVDPQTIFVADLPRLAEFARFVAERDGGWGWALREGLEDTRRR
jgi:CRP/FNR family transcriptional regulator, cyclic AMP receptor protein